MNTTSIKYHRIDGKAPLSDEHQTDEKTVGRKGTQKIEPVKPDLLQKPPGNRQRPTDTGCAAIKSISERTADNVDNCQLQTNLKLGYITSKVRIDYPKTIDININRNFRCGADRFVLSCYSDPTGHKDFKALRDVLAYGQTSYNKARVLKYDYYLRHISGLKGQALNSELLALETGKRLKEAGAKVVDLVRITSSLTITSMIYHEHYLVVIDRECAGSEHQRSKYSKGGAGEEDGSFEIVNPGSFSDASVICDTRLNVFCPSKDYINLAGNELEKLFHPGSSRDQITSAGADSGTHKQWVCIYRFPDKEPSRLSTLANSVKAMFVSGSQ